MPQLVSQHRLPADLPVEHGLPEHGSFSARSARSTRSATAGATFWLSSSGFERTAVG
nr:hypothetical protein [Saccharopolyspora rhizosphaerae]